RQLGRLGTQHDGADQDAPPSCRSPPVSVAGARSRCRASSSPATRAGYVLVKDDKFVTVAEPSPSRMTRAGHRITERPGPTPKDRISGQPMNLLRMLFHRIRPADVTMTRVGSSTAGSDRERSTPRAPTTTLDTSASEGVAKKETLAPLTRLGV